MKKTCLSIALLALSAPAALWAQSTVSGECQWTLDAAGTLTIKPADGVTSLPAKLPEWEDGGAPWAAKAEQVRRVVIPTTADGGIAVEATTLRTMFKGMKLADCFDLSGLQLAYVGQTTMVQNMFSGCERVKMIKLSAGTNLEWSATAIAIQADVANTYRLQVVAGGTPFAPAGAAYAAADIVRGLDQADELYTGGYTVVLTRRLTTIDDSGQDQTTYKLTAQLDADNGLGTLCWPVSVSSTDSEGKSYFEAYTVTGTEADPSHTGHDDAVLVLQRVNTQDNHYWVPPHTPVIICGDPGAEISLPLKENNNTTTTHTTGYYSLAPVPVTATGDWLVGSYTPILFDGQNDYVLQVHPDSQLHPLGFFWVNPEGHYYTTAHRCFLRVPGEQTHTAFSLQVPSHTTASITAPDAVASPKPAARQGIYTLAGERVSHMEPGRVYILNGRKVIVR